jgi:protein-tyrosine-phosphatase
MFKVLIVCTANVCRSPMGEAILRRMIKEKGLEDHLQVESVGIYAMDGQKSSDLTIEVCKENRLDLSDHRSRSITPHDIQNSNLILCMTPDHKQDLDQFFPGEQEKISTLREYGSTKQLAKLAIDDPIGMSLNFYRRIFREIEIELKRIFPFLTQQAQKR